MLAEFRPVSGAPEAIEVQTKANTVLPAINKDVTCADWVAWVPRVPQPAVIMQVNTSAVRSVRCLTCAGV